MSAAAVGFFLLTIAIGSMGGWLMWTLHLPLAWLLGSMIACGIASAAGLPLGLPRFARPPMTAAIGAMLGSSFNLAFFSHIGGWVVTIIGLAGFISVAGTLSYLFFRKVGGLDHPTAYFSSMPGGVVEMVTLGHERGGEEKMIALIQASRIFFVVLTLPFVIEHINGSPIGRSGATAVPLSSFGLIDLFWFVLTAVIGIGLGTILRLPARYLLGPMLVSGALHLSEISDFQLPTMMLSAAQVVIGATIGARFSGTPPRLIGKVLLLSLGSITMLVTVSVAFSLGLSMLVNDSFVAILLAYSPGGLAEMSLIALALNIEVPFVVIHHLVRVIFVLLGSSLTFAALQRLRKS